ncbi:MAG: class I SAM-dependent methyltransferase [Pseudomonadota bacterium]|nr:class I SAM-dependent methyltransferase [Pseudomonadota bacterium]
MERIPEPELMDEPQQALAYARADFDSAHSEIMDHYPRLFPDGAAARRVLDLGCGTGDISVRIARLCPGARIDAVDGAEAMLDHARTLREATGLAGRIDLIHERLPSERLADGRYDTVISNSLLHHLHDPGVLWSTVRRAGAAGARVFVADLTRPENEDSARELVERYTEGEPDILRHDFFHSLLAAFTPKEIDAQLRESGLQDVLQVTRITDRHIVVYGRLP